MQENKKEKSQTTVHLACKYALPIPPQQQSDKFKAINIRQDTFTTAAKGAMPHLKR